MDVIRTNQVHGKSILRDGTEQSPSGVAVERCPSNRALCFFVQVILISAFRASISPVLPKPLFRHRYPQHNQQMLFQLLLLITSKMLISLHPRLHRTLYQFPHQALHQLTSQTPHGNEHSDAVLSNMRGIIGLPRDLYGETT
jgi:hypothetical protein